MNSLMTQLKEYGADIDGIMARFLGDMDLYKMCYATFLADEYFAKLGEALNKEDYKNAFDFAHTLKGAAGNMGLMPLYKLICSIVEDLRGRNYCQLQSTYTKVIEQLDKLKAIKY